MTKPSLAFEVLKYFDFCDQVVVVLSKLCRDSCEMIRRNTHTFCAFLCKRELVFCDRAQTEKLLSWHVAFFKLHIIFGVGALNEQDLAKYIRELTKILNERTCKVLKLEETEDPATVQAISESRIKYFPVEVFLVEKSPSDKEMEISFDTVYKTLLEIDRNLSDNVLKKFKIQNYKFVKVYRVFQRSVTEHYFANVPVYINSLDSFHCDKGFPSSYQLVSDYYIQEEFPEDIISEEDLQTEGLGTPSPVDRFLQKLCVKTFSLVLATHSKHLYGMAYGDIKLTSTSADALRKNSALNDTIQELTICGLEDQGFLDEFFQNPHLPPMKHLQTF